MTTRFFKVVALAAFLLFSVKSQACTTVIFSGKATLSGKPVMLKNRDTGELNNRLELFKGPSFHFVGLVNSPRRNPGEVWAGVNEKGFCIMNTASYNFKEDDIPADKMDGEGILMFKALGICETVEDFELFLSEYPKPMYVEANFGVIDANGGAAYFEVNNTRWVKYDVNDPETAPDGYRVVTNFCRAGRKENYQGWERFLTASAVMEELPRDENNLYDVDHNILINSLCRSYRHEFLGLKNIDGFDVFIDRDFIPRKSTASAVVFEGVRPGENPSHTLMWSLLGYPAVSVAVPVLVGNDDIIPEYLKKTADSRNSELCSTALKLKDGNIFRFKVSSGANYFDASAVRKMIPLAVSVENFINEDFESIYVPWEKGEISDESFYDTYIVKSKSYYRKYLDAFGCFLKND